MTGADLGYTPIHEAGSNNRNPAVLTLLLDMGADINAKNTLGETPMYMAASENSNRAVIELLIERGGDLLIQNNAGRSSCDLLRIRYDYDC